MTRPDACTTRESERGYALIFALGAMLVMLIVGLRFLAVVHLRQLTSDNEKAALQASLLADAGVARAAYELSQDMTWAAGYTDLALGDGTYSVAVTGSGADYVQVTATGSFRGTTRTRVAKVYTPAPSGTTILWGAYYGSGNIEWADPQRVIDSADGENDSFAYHLMGDPAQNEMSVAAFGSDIRGAAITKVEIVISGYISQKTNKQSLLVAWHLAGSAATGTWHEWNTKELDGASGYDARGRLSLDVTKDPPPGGWQWRHFYHGTDLELWLMTQSSGSSKQVWMYLDCVGFRVSWQAQ